MHSSHILAALVLSSMGLAARADSFNFSFGTSSSPFSGSGVLTTGTPEAPGEYPIDSVTGLVETVPNGTSLKISSILPSGSFPTPTNGGSFPANDNTLFVANNVGSFSQDGLSFTLGNGAQINLYNDGPGDDALLERSSGADVVEDVTITITPVATTPEPSTFVLLGTGVLAVAGAVKRRLA